MWFLHIAQLAANNSKNPEICAKGSIEFFLYEVVEMKSKSRCSHCRDCAPIRYEDGTPVLKAYPAGGTQVLVLCPEGCHHLHGWNGNSKREHRRAHCVDRGASPVGGGYYFEVQAGALPMDVWRRHKFARPEFISLDGGEAS